MEPVIIGNADGLNLTAYAVGDTTNLFVTIINKEHGADARDAAVTITPDDFSFRNAGAMFLTARRGGAGGTKGMAIGGAPITNHAP